MVLALAVMTFWNVAGYYDDSEPRGVSDAVWLHGWPATYLIRGVYRDPSLLARRQSMGWEWEPKWSASFVWGESTGAGDFAFVSLAFDCGIALLMALAVGCVFEIWRRRRHHLFQYHLSDLCIAVIVIAGVLAYGRHAALTTAALEEIQLHQFSRYIDVEWRRGTPECVRVLLPGGWWKPGDYAAGMRFSQVVLADEDLDLICSQTRLRSIALSNVEMDFPQDWQRLVACGQIEKLSLSGKPLQDEEFAFLPRFPNLRKLDLSLDQLSEESLRCVGRIKTLEELVIYEECGSEGKLKGPELRHLGELPALAKLSLGFEYQREAPSPHCDLYWVGQCRHLRSLTIDHKRLTSRDVAGLSRLSELEALTVWGSELEQPKDGELLLASLRNLKRLQFGLPLVGPAFWREHAQSMGLEELSTSLDDEGLKWVSRLHSLRRLENSSGKVTNAGVKALSEHPRLEFLLMASDLIDDGAIESIAAMRTLRELDIVCCRNITIAGRQRLAAMRPDIKFVGGGPCWQDY